MALVGKYIKYESVDTGKTEINKIEYPIDLEEGHPDFKKAGTTEEVESSVYDIISTEYENAYVTVHSINSWKFKSEEKDETLFNITYRVYENKYSREIDINSHIKEDYIHAQTLDFKSNKNDTQQAYELLKTAQGCEELIND